MPKNFTLNLDNNVSAAGRGKLVIKGIVKDFESDELGITGIPIKINIPDETLAYARNVFIENGYPESTPIIISVDNAVSSDNTITFYLMGIQF